jgi:hypothetical protein
MLVWCLALLVVMLTQWVAIWGLESHQGWTMREFFLVVISPLLYYIAAHLLISSNPEKIESWADHLQTVSRPILSLMVLATCNFLLRNYIIQEEFSIAPLFSGLLFTINVLAIITIALPKRGLVAASGFAWMLPTPFGILINVRF